MNGGQLHTDFTMNRHRWTYILRYFPHLPLNYFRINSLSVTEHTRLVRKYRYPCFWTATLLPKEAPKSQDAVSASTRNSRTRLACLSCSFRVCSVRKLPVDSLPREINWRSMAVLQCVHCVDCACGGEREIQVWMSDVPSVHLPDVCVLCVCLSVRVFTGRVFTRGRLPRGTSAWFPVCRKNGLWTRFSLVCSSIHLPRRRNVHSITR